MFSCNELNFFFIRPPFPFWDMACIIYSFISVGLWVTTYPFRWLEQDQQLWVLWSRGSHMSHNDGSPDTSMIAGYCHLAVTGRPSCRFLAWHFTASEFLKLGYQWTVSTKMQKLFELTSHLKHDCAFLAQKVGFVHQADRLVLPVCRALYGVMKRREIGHLPVV